MKKTTIIIIHLVYWLRLLLSGFQVIYLSTRQDAFIVTFRLQETAVLWGIFIFQLVALFPFYLAYCILFPIYFVRKKYIAFGTLTLATILLTFLIQELSIFYFKHVFRDVLSFLSSNHFGILSPFNVRLWNTVIITTGSITSGSLLRALILWFNERKLKENLEKKNLQTELALLRAQINPHFLFNTLNNIDILIEKSPAKASEYLKKLSDIMRFTIYDASAEKILLSQELEYLRKYIDLQRIRSTASDFVKFEVIGDPKELLIAPMLFIPFIENAFKHCTNKKQANAISITIRIIGKEIYFSCTNLLDKIHGIEKTKGGAGLDIIKNRLTLMYPDHILHMEKTESQYIIGLNIKLNEN